MLTCSDARCRMQRWLTSQHLLIISNSTYTLVWTWSFSDSAVNKLIVKIVYRGYTFIMNIVYTFLSCINPILSCVYTVLSGINSILSCMNPILSFILQKITLQAPYKMLPSCSDKLRKTLYNKPFKIILTWLSVWWIIHIDIVYLAVCFVSLASVSKTN